MNGGILVRYTNDSGEDSVDENRFISDSVHSWGFCTSKVRKITVWGDQLDEVREHITGIPDKKNEPCVSWFGDHAKFIVDNFF